MIGNLKKSRRVISGVVLSLTISMMPPAGSGFAQRGTVDPQPGSPDSGDSLFPHQGNGGYDVDSYRIVFTWVRSGRIHATTRVKAVAAQDLSSFNVDLHGLTVDSVRVGGAPATFTRSGSELTISPTSPVLVDTDFAFRVAYHGMPQTFVDPDGSADGWIRTPDGATVLGEPVGAMTWFPNNDTPRDKARYRIIVTAPKGLEVVSNGRLAEVDVGARVKTWHWSMRDPMATYLASVSIGQYAQVVARTGDGIRLRSYFDPTVGGKRLASRLPEVLRYWQRLFGDYPFTSAGIVIDDVAVGYSLEVQTRPVFPYVPGMSTLVHELAHQWFGDSVTPVDWSDIWLNEGFATYAEWLWEARQTPGAPRRNFQQLYDSHGPASSFWDIPVAVPGDPANLFGNAVYIRGAMALQALRMTIGRDDFFDLLRSWHRIHRDKNGTTAQLLRLAERISGTSLDQLFDDWLYSSSKPPAF